MENSNTRSCTADFKTSQNSRITERKDFCGEQQGQWWRTTSETCACWNLCVSSTASKWSSIINYSVVSYFKLITQECQKLLKCHQITVSGLWGDIRKCWRVWPWLKWKQQKAQKRSCTYKLWWRQNFRSISHQTPQATAPMMKLPNMKLPMMKLPMMKLPIMKLPIMKAPSCPFLWFFFLFYFKTPEKW